MGIGIEDGIGVGDDSKTPGGGGGAVNTVNNVAPVAGGNVQLDASDVKARPDTWTPTAQETGAVATADMPEELKKLLDSGVEANDVVMWDPTSGKLIRAGLKVVNNVLVAETEPFKVGTAAGLLIDAGTTPAIVPVDDKGVQHTNRSIAYSLTGHSWVIQTPLSVQDRVSCTELFVKHSGSLGLDVEVSNAAVSLEIIGIDGIKSLTSTLAYNLATDRWTINGRNIVLSDEFETLKARVKANEDAITALQQAAGPSGSPTHHDPVGFDPTKADVLGGFSADDWGGIIAFSTHKAGGDITIHKTGTDAQYAYLLFKPTDATHVHGFKIDNGLEAQWPSKDVTIQGKQYTAFRSPYKLTMSPLDIETVWSK